MIAFGADRALLGARVLKDELTRRYELELAPGSRKIRLDGKVPRPLARYFGAFNVVVFTPEDLALPRGSPGDRRRFLDRGVFNLDPAYLGVAQDYERVLRSRNAVLRQAAEGSVGSGRVDELLAVYDQQLARLAVDVRRARTRFLDEICELLAKAFAAITRADAKVSARYVAK